LAAPLQLHATSVVLNEAVRAFGGPEGFAVVLMGPPGSGKSDLALRLIAAGGKLIADDLTRLTSDGERLYAEAGPNMVGFMEVRHIGIVKLEHAARAPIALVAELDSAGEFARLPEMSFYRPPPPLTARRLPVLIRIDPREASAAEKVAVAASSAFLDQIGMNAAPENSL